MQSKVKGILYNQTLKWLKATLFKVNYFPLEKVVIGRYFSVSSNICHLVLMNRNGFSISVNLTSTTTACALLEASKPCESGSECVEEGNGPVCR